MKLQYFLFFTMLLSLNSMNGQVDSSNFFYQDLSEIHGKEAKDGCILPELMTPYFPGGYDSLHCFLENSWRGSEIEEREAPGRILVRFSIDSSGIAQNLEVNPIDLIGSNQVVIIKDETIVNLVLKTFSSMPTWDTTSSSKEISFIYILRFPYEFKCARFR